jgi:hypothetical protein
MNEEEKKQYELEKKHPILRHIAEANLRNELEPCCTKCGEVLDPVEDLDWGNKNRPHTIGFFVFCDTCGKPQRLCAYCWNDTDDCNECEESREKEQWCPLCDLVCVNMTPVEKQQHMAAHKSENCDCVVDLEGGSTIKPCALHPQGGSPKGMAIYRAMKAGKAGRL